MSPGSTLAGARALARHVALPAAGAAPAAAAAALGLDERAAAALVATIRLQLRLSRMLEDAAALPPAPADPEPAALLDRAGLDRAALATGAALHAHELAATVTREARTALARWLPAEARAFALARRAEVPARRPVGLGRLRCAVETAGRAARAAWRAELRAGDEARVLLRLPDADPPPPALGADPALLVRLFRAAAAHASGEADDAA